MALVSSYSDMSEEGGHMAIGAYLFRKSKIRPFEKAWRRILRKYDLPYFRMAECNAAKGVFDGLGDTECTDAASVAIQAIHDHAAVGFFVTMKRDDFDQIIKGGVSNQPFVLMLHMYFLMVNLWMQDNNPNGRVSYFFESGDEGEGDARNVLRVMFANEERRQQFYHRSDAFVEKKCSMPTQAADMLAWHARKHHRRHHEGNSRLRGDFAHLYNGMRHISFEATPERLRQLVDTLNNKAGGPGGVKLAGIVLRELHPKILRDREALERLIQGLD